MGVTKEERKYNLKLFSEGKRKCGTCKEIKSLSEFYKNNSIKSKNIPFVPVCKSCCSKKAKAQYKEVKEWLSKRKKRKDENRNKLNKV